MRSVRVEIVCAILLIVHVVCNAAARSKSGRMPMEKIKLYYFPPSPPCRVVILTSKMLGLELDLQFTNLMEGDHLTEDYLKMNPQHTIPVIDDSGFILWESRAIIAYLVTSYGKDDSLYPKNPRIRAVIDQRLYFDMGTLYQRYSDLYLPVIFYGKDFDEEKADKLREAISWMDMFLEGKAYVAGDNLTIADISMAVTFTNLEAFEFDFSSFENVVKWFARMKKALEPYGYEEVDVAGAKMVAMNIKKQ